MRKKYEVEAFRTVDGRWYYTLDHHPDNSHAVCTEVFYIETPSYKSRAYARRKMMELLAGTNIWFTEVKPGRIL